MPSSRSVPDPLDPGRAGFAHRGLHGEQVPENSLPAFAAALEAEAGIECDLRLTADERIVIFHDRDASRMCGSPLAIGASTLAQVQELRIGEQPIPKLGELLALVAGRVPLLLEVKVDRDVRRWAPALTRELRGYSGPFGILSFDPRIARLLKNGMPGVRRGLNIEAGLPPLRRALYRALADPDFLGVERDALPQPWVAMARQRMPVYAWTIRTAVERAQAEVQADALIWEADGGPRV